MQAAREEEAANRRSMAGQDAFEELKRMAAATIAATPLGLRGAAAPADAGAKVAAEASTSGTGETLFVLLLMAKVRNAMLRLLSQCAAFSLDLARVDMMGLRALQACAAPQWTCLHACD